MLNGYSDRSFEVKGRYKYINWANFCFIRIPSEKIHKVDVLITN